MAARSDNMGATTKVAIHRKKEARLWLLSRSRQEYTINHLKKFLFRLFVRKFGRRLTEEAVLRTLLTLSLYLSESDSMEKLLAHPNFYGWAIQVCRTAIA